MVSTVILMREKFEEKKTKFWKVEINGINNISIK